MTAAQASGRTIRSVALDEGVLTGEQIDELLSPEAVCRLGTPEPLGRSLED